MSKLAAKAIAIAFSITGTSLIAAQHRPYAVMPEEAVGHINARLCSREAVTGIDGSWNPSAALVGRVERHLKQISKLPVEAGITGAHIQNPESYFRQYFGTTVAGHQLVYLNAFVEPDGSSPSNWRQELVTLCDGGSKSWGVSYDPATGKFLHLQTNGTGPPPSN